MMAAMWRGAIPQLEDISLPQVRQPLSKTLAAIKVLVVL